MSVYSQKEWNEIKKMFAERNKKRNVIHLDVIRLIDNGGGYYTLEAYNQLDQGNLVVGQRVKFNYNGQVVLAEIIDNDYQVLIVREVANNDLSM